jgi:hypothetical protein
MTAKKNKSGVREHYVYKYTKGPYPTEQIMLGNKSVFLQIVADKPVILDKIDLVREQNTVLYPREDDDIRHFSFENEEEIQQIITETKSTSIDHLYQICKSFWQKLVVAEDKDMTLLTADTIYSFFQDRFSTTHLVILIGSPGTGKGAILATFVLVGYRAVLTGNMRGSTILDLVGSMEHGQITILEDELLNIEDDADKRNLYTIGYDITASARRTINAGTANRQNKKFKPFCFKMMGAEDPPDAKKFSGFNDRSFYIYCLIGKPRYYVKELWMQERELMEDADLQLLLEIEKFKKLMIIYRLLHRNEKIKRTKTNVSGRAWELTNPLVSLFNADNLSTDKTAIKEIVPVLSTFLKDRGKLRERTLQSVIYEVIKKHCNATTDNTVSILNDDIISGVMERSNGEKIHFQQAFYSPMFGKVIHKAVYDACRTTFKGQEGSANVKVADGYTKKRNHSFDKNIIDRISATYEYVSELEILNNGHVYSESNTTSGESTSTIVRKAGILDIQEEIEPDSSDRQSAQKSASLDGSINLCMYMYVIGLNRPQLLYQSDPKPILPFSIVPVYTKQTNSVLSYYEEKQSKIQETLGRYEAKTNTKV